MPRGQITPSKKGGLATRLKALELQARDAFNQNSLTSATMPVAAQQMLRDQLSSKTRLANLEARMIQSSANRALGAMDVGLQSSKDEAANKRSTTNEIQNAEDADRNHWLAQAARGLSIASGVSGFVSNMATSLSKKGADGLPEVTVDPNIELASNIAGELSQEDLSGMDMLGGANIKGMSVGDIKEQRFSDKYRRQYKEGILGGIGKKFDWLARGADKILPGSLSSDEAGVRALGEYAAYIAKKDKTDAEIMQSYRKALEFLGEAKAAAAMSLNRLGATEEEFGAEMRVLTFMAGLFGFGPDFVDRNKKPGGAK